MGVKGVSLRTITVGETSSKALACDVGFVAHAVIEPSTACLVELRNDDARRLGKQVRKLAH